MTKKLFAWGLVLAVCLFIFLMSEQPAEQSAKTSEGVTQQIAQIVIEDYSERSPSEKKSIVQSLHPVVRKLAHASEYLVLGFAACMLWQLYAFSARKRLLLSFLLCVAVAASDELHQLFVDGRGAMVTDVLIDCSGAVTGILIAFAGQWLWKKCKRKPVA